MTSTFDEWWALFPHKVGKKKAEKKYWIVRRDTEHEILMEGLRRYIETKPAWKAWCNPETWLNQGRWEDQPADVAQPTQHDSPIRPCPSYLRQQREDKPPPTPEQKAKKRLRLDVHEVMRARQINPHVMRIETPDLYEAEFQKIAQQLGSQTSRPS